MAKKSSGWGALFGAIALGVLVVNENNQEKKRLQNQKLIEENNRIKEQLRQEKIQRESQKPLEQEEEFTQEELKNLYYDLAKKYHPDHAQSEQDKEFRNQLFIKLKDAYEKKDMKTLRMYKIN